MRSHRENHTSRPRRVLRQNYAMPIRFLIKALLDNRKRFEQRAAEIGEEKLFAEEPRAKGYLRPRAGTGCLSRGMR